MPEVDKKEKFFGLLVAIIAFLVYANSLGNGFAWDDSIVILNNPALKGTALSIFSSIDTVSDAMPSPYYRPLTLLSFFFEQRLHGFNPFYVRMLNVLLHTANTYLLYQLSRILFKNNYAALLAALLFAIHPIHTEGVDFNAGGRNTMLACLFVLSAYLLHARSITRGNVSLSFAAAVLFLAGLFSKESALGILPFIIVLESAFFFTGTGTSRIAALLRFTPYVAATACYMIMRWSTLSKFGIQTSIIPGLGTKGIDSLYIIPSMASRLMDNIYIIPRYLLTVIRPTALSPIYSVPEDLNLLVLPLATAWLMIFIALGWILSRGRSPATLFGLSWLFIFWLPVSGLIYFPSSPLADRYLYLPVIGLWIIIADQATRQCPTEGKLRAYSKYAALAIFVILASLTMKRNLDWKSEIALFTRAVQQYPDDARSHASLAGAYFNEKGRNGQYALLSEQENEIALSLNPTIQMVHTPLGHLKLDRGDWEGALHHYTMAINIFPYDKQARLNRGITYQNLGRLDEARADFQFFLSIPGYNMPGSREFVEERVRHISEQIQSTQ